MRDGATTATTLDFTGQRKDDSGLLFYNARYYDPSLARFISADTVVPGSGALTMQALDVTEALHWTKDRVGTPNPSTLNRYAYVQNNPVGTTDTSGHCAEVISCTLEGGAAGTFVAPGVGTAVGAVAGFVVGAAITLGAAYVVSEVISSVSNSSTPPSTNTAKAVVISDAPTAYEARSKDRSGKDFTAAGRRKVVDENRQTNQGVVRCQNCGIDTVPSQKSVKGVTPPSNEAQVDHIIPRSRGGAGDPSNGQVLCRACNRAKSDKYDPQ